ncbi:MAG: nucleotidyltransferase [Candidatus Woesearchaeota archaeon]
MQKDAGEVRKMINTQDQEELFRLIADYLDNGLECTAIGGTAMMFHGYKNATKDIDLVFSNEKDRNYFIKAIEKLGYKEKALTDIYDEKRRKHAGKPKMFTRGEERFDLFLKNIFGFELKTAADSTVQRHDFIGKKELTVKTPGNEYLILLKAITGREKDMEDIEAIIKTESSIDWELITDEAIAQRKNNGWIIYDLEKAMQQLKKITLIKKKYFDKLYKAEEKAGK